MIKIIRSHLDRFPTEQVAAAAAATTTPWRHYVTRHSSIACHSYGACHFLRSTTSSALSLRTENEKTTRPRVESRSKHATLKKRFPKGLRALNSLVLFLFHSSMLHKHDYVDRFTVDSRLSIVVLARLIGRAIKG